MERTKFQRLCALLLVLACLIPGGMMGVAAEDVTSSADTDTSVSDKTIADVREQLNAISYEEYRQDLEDVKRGDAAIVVDGKSYDKDATDAKVEINTYDGVEALYTPDSGNVVWNITVPETAKYSIVIDYYPVEGKATSIQRIFRIDGAIPFAEARYITMAKRWEND